MIRSGLTALVLAAAGLGAGLAQAGGSTATCGAGALAAVYVDSSGAAGSVDAEYGFRNRLRAACVLRGYPMVQMLTASGKRLSTTDLRAPGAYGIAVVPVVLAPAATAYFGIHYAAQTGYGRLKCPASAALRLSAPGTRGGRIVRGRGGRIQPYGGTITHLHCGIVRVSAVTSKRFQ